MNIIVNYYSKLRNVIPRRRQPANVAFPIEVDPSFAPPIDSTKDPPAMGADKVFKRILRVAVDF
jgi:hypothetical protein